ncbi:hypothetical protein JCM14469_04940 [Desulfatiferula olefinivorans]
MNTDTQTTKNTASNAVILVLALVGFGIVFGGFGLFRYQTAKKSLAWPSTTGTITSARAESRKADKGFQYMPSVRYTYSVNQTRYTGSRITASDTYEKTKSRAEKILRDYPVGGAVTVYYDPEKPGESLLVTGMKANVYGLLAAGIFCLFFAVAVGVSALKGKQQTE